MSETRGGLGRGLSALIPSGARSLRELPAGQIRPSARQPRGRFGEEALAELAASIKQVGLVQPVVVRPVSEDRYELVAGERRWRAAQIAGLDRLPVIVLETDDQGAIERALVENLHREDLNAIELAAGFRALLTDAGLTHEELAERVGLSRPAVTNALRLLELPLEVQGMVIEGRLTAGHARTLLTLGDHPLMVRLAQRIAAEGMSVRDAERLVKQAPPTAARPASPSRQFDAGLGEVALRLSEELGTVVKVTMGRRKGRVVVEFGSLEDLKRIYRQITG